MSPGHHRRLSFEGAAAFIHSAEIVTVAVAGVRPDRLAAAIDTDRGFALGGISVDSRGLGSLVTSHPVDVVIVAASPEEFAVWREATGRAVPAPALVHVVPDADLPRARAAAHQADVSVVVASASAETLRTAVRAAALGLRVTPRFEKADAAAQLTAREREVLRLLAEGVGNKLISRRLSISPNTVKFHVSAILEKLSASTRTEAVAIALRSGLLLH